MQLTENFGLELQLVSKIILRYQKLMLKKYLWITQSHTLIVVQNTCLCPAFYSYKNNACAKGSSEIPNPLLIKDQQFGHADKVIQ